MSLGDPYDAVPPGGYAPDEDELEDEEEVEGEVEDEDASD